MSKIRLVDAAKHFKGLTHQMAAWNWLESELTAAQLSEFAEIYRADPPLKEPLVQQGPARFSPGAPFNTKVTPHFTYGELTLDDERRRFTNQGQCDIASELCTFLEKVRVQFGGKSIVISSGHRPPAINAAVGGASDSEHLYKPGCGAVDFWVKGESIYVVQDWCDKNWPFSLGYGAPKGFVHLGIRARRPRVRWDY